jgi:hypothetical protein
MKKGLLLLVFFLSACNVIDEFQATATPLPTETPKPTATIAPTSTRIPTPTKHPTRTPLPAKCVMDNEFLIKLKRAVPYEKFSLYHNIIGDIHSLAVWYVDPEINHQISEEELAGELEKVIDQASELAYLLLEVDPCVAQTFNAFNPIVVDENYTGWFSGMLDLSEIGVYEGNVGLIRNLYRGSYRINKLHQEIGNPPPGSCSWEETEEKLWHHFSRERQNVAFYFVHDRNGYNVWAQWDGIGFLPLESAAMLNVMMELDCLYPQPDQLIIMIVGDTGELTYADMVELD